MFQRSGSTGTIQINGTGATSGEEIEARWDGGDWSTIGTAAGDGSFSGELTGLAQGQGALEVRMKDDADSTVSVANVGIGDVFVLAGQSNSEGYGTNNQVYSHATLKAAKYTGAWAELTDPTDPQGAGSPWPLLATLFMADQGIPVAFVPCGVSGVSITTWLPGQSHYETMKTRALATGCKAVLWHQGESDVIAGMSQATYNGHLDTVANGVNSDLGVPLVACKIVDMSTYNGGYDETAVNAAIAEAWGDNANVIEGPDFSDITPSVDGVHFKTDTELDTAADRWWAALETAFYT